MKRPEQLHWGILSTARINEALIFALRGAPRSELVAVASRDLGKARAYAAQQGIPAFYGSYDQLLADPAINAVYLPLPNSMHCEWAIRAAEARKNVLVEKPIATSMADLDAIEAAARDNSVVIFEALMALHAPQNRKVQELIQQGRIGELHLISSWFSYYLPPEDSQDIRLNRELDGGSFWDVGVYPNSLAITMAGGRAPRQVWAVQDIGETGVDVGLAGQMHFANGTIAQIYCGLRAPFVQDAQFVGSDGMIHIREPWIPGMSGRSQPGSDSIIELTDRAGHEEKIVVPASNPWQKEVEAMEACVIDGAGPIVPLSLSREFLKTARALHESARSGMLVEL
jgi:xylose dehydrogenase (NAD/NADP)